MIPVPKFLTQELPEKMPQRTSLNSWIKKVSGFDDLSSHRLRGAWRTTSREAGITDAMTKHLFGHANDILGEPYGESSDEAKLAAMQKVWAVIESWCGD